MLRLPPACEPSHVIRVHYYNAPKKKDKGREHDSPLQFREASHLILGTKWGKLATVDKVFFGVLFRHSALPLQLLFLCTARCSISSTAPSTNMTVLLFEMVMNLPASNP